MGDFQIQVIPDFQSMIITAVSLIILYILYKKFLYVPVNTFLQERRNYIQSEIKDAKALKEKARLLREDQEATISKAEHRAQDIIEMSRKFGEEIKESIIQEAREEAREIILKAEKEIERQKKIALDEIKTMSIDMGVLIASKIMEEEISVDKQNYLIDKFIDEVGSSEWLS